MSGMQQALMGGRTGAINPTLSSNILNESSVHNIYTGSLTFAADGTCSQSPTGSPANWFIPTTPGVGAGWSVRFTQTSAVFTDYSSGNVTPGIWVALAAGATFSVKNTGTSNEAVGNGTLAFSPDGGTTVINSGSLSWSVGWTP